MTKMLGVILPLGLMLASCSQGLDFDDQAGERQGQLSFKLDSKADFTVNTRALQESAYKNVDNYTVVVVDKDGTEKLNCKYSEVSSKMPLTLPIGGFSIKAFYGKESAASRDEFYVVGTEQGTIKANQKESVMVTCTPTCGRISVAFASDMDTYFSDYNVTFTGPEALGTNTIAWLKGETEPWYVKLKDGDAGENINFTITTTTKDEYLNGNKEQVTTKNGTFKLSRNKAYKMKINTSYNPSGTGNVDIEVTIDESTNDKHIDIEVPVEWL